MLLGHVLALMKTKRLTFDMFKFQQIQIPVNSGAFTAPDHADIQLQNNVHSRLCFKEN